MAKEDDQSAPEGSGSAGEVTSEKVGPYKRGEIGVPAKFKFKNNFHFKCQDCGGEVKETDEFCQHCGAKFLKKT